MAELTAESLIALIEKLHNRPIPVPRDTTREWIDGHYAPRPQGEFRLLTDEEKQKHRESLDRINATLYAKAYELRVDGCRTGRTCVEKLKFCGGLSDDQL